MRKWLLVTGLLCLMVWLPVAGAQAETITVLHLNDTHSHLLPWGPKGPDGAGQWGGYARLATAVGMARMTEPNVMLLHAGDVFVGDFMFQKYVGIPEFMILKQLGCDAMELGNHEFDLYPSTLKYVLSEAGFPAAGFPVLCANMDFSADPEMIQFIKPYTIKEYGDVKVGIFGLITDFVNTGSNPSPFGALPPVDVAQAWVDTLREGHGCDVVILLSHAGFASDQMIAASTSGIDVIVGGHSHTQVDEPLVINGTLLVQAGEHAKYLGKLRLEVEEGAIAGWDYDLVPIDATVPAAPAVDTLLMGLVMGVEADPRFGPVFTEAVASAAIDLDKTFGHGLVMDNPMGNLVSDAFREIAGTDIAIQPQGFINQPIWAGPLTGNDIFQAVPYGFDEESGYGLKLVTLQTTGMSLVAGLEFSVYYLPYLEDFFLHGSNLSFAYHSGYPAGARVDYSSIVIDGLPLNPYGVYSVTVPDGVVPFLSQIPGFVMENLQMLDEFMYTAVRDFMTANSPVSYYREGRIFDLAVLDNPVQGAEALADLPGMYYMAGLITDAEVAEHFSGAFAVVAKHLAGGRMQPAQVKLEATKRQLGVQAKVGTVAPEAAQGLSYLIDKLVMSVGGKSLVCNSAGAAEAAGMMPSDVLLLQNYPNPFNPTTQIEFTLGAAAHVNLEIFNILGQQVTTLIDGEMSEGRHSVEWDAASYAGGFYFYRLTAGDMVSTKKMLLVK